MTPELRTIERLTDKAMHLLRQRDEAIVAARQAGFTLRELGQAARLNHQTIVNILQRETDRDA